MRSMIFLPMALRPRLKYLCSLSGIEPVTHWCTHVWMDELGLMSLVMCD